MDEGYPIRNKLRSLESNFGELDAMLKRTYALLLPLWDAFSPLQPMQVKSRSISRLVRKMPQLLVL